MSYFTPFNIRTPFGQRGPRTRTEQFLELVFEASRTLASTLDLKQTLKTVAQMAVPQLADWCIVDLVDENGALKRLVTAHKDPNMIEVADEFAKIHPRSLDTSTGV